jgi:hypothetical protein
MGVVPEDRREATLREWGVSEPLIRLSSGDILHPLFRDSHEGPPWYVYHGEVGVPKGPAFAPLWEFCERATGIRKRRGGLEFIRYSFGSPEEYTVRARTEQGFWATVFDFLYESDAPLDALQSAADVVGFRFLGRLLAVRGEAELGTFESHGAYLRKLVVGIDREVLKTAEPDGMLSSGESGGSASDRGNTG